MIVCPECEHLDYLGTMFCSECGSPLITDKRVATMDIPLAHLQNQLEVDAAEKGFKIKPETGALAALRLMPTGKIISLVGRSTFSLGRAVPKQAIIPDVDLEPFNALTTGVSRIHADLSFDEHGIRLKDLDSANGTLLNDHKLDPQMPVPVKNLDVIQLGNFRFQLLLQWL